MRLVRSSCTGPEVRAWEILTAAGLRFKRNDSSVYGSPDATLPGRVALFVDGAFWHPRCRRCRPGLPRTRREWWRRKLRRNLARDRRVTAALRARGWTVLRFCEHVTRSDAGLVRIAREAVAASETGRRRAKATRLARPREERAGLLRRIEDDRARAQGLVNADAAEGIYR